MKTTRKMSGCLALILTWLVLAVPFQLQAQSFFAGLSTPSSVFFSLIYPNVETVEVTFRDGNPSVTGADTASPVNKIISPTSGLRVTNSVFAITGKATDYYGVAGVYYSINSSPWLPVSVANDWTNWIAYVNLIPGTNVVQSYAVDTSGNYSPTSSVSFFAVFLTPIAVLTNGNGTLSPNYNGSSLTVTQKYSITATPAAGYAFSNWTGMDSTILTNGRTLNFTMASNLVLTANFVDVTRPTLAITSPALNQVFSNSIVTAPTNSIFPLRGTASDNKGISQVFYQLNSNPWTNATGTTSWTGSLALQPGTNVIRAYATDLAGNNSATSSVPVTYLVTAQLTVQTNQPGWGVITPNLNKSWLVLDRNYTLTATAATGFRFTNWSSNFGTVSNAAALNFKMRSELTLTASFADLARPALTIASPTVNQVFSNSLVTIATNSLFPLRGTASDNVGISQVFYQLNTSPWTNATGTANWTGSLALQPGTNTIRAYALDAAGNNSATSSVPVTYLVTARLTVQTNQTGWGLVTPNLNKAWLVLDRNYTLTATAAAGFRFTNWTSNFDLVSNAAALNFKVQSNLTLTANFVDNARPSLTILAPAANLQVSNSQYTVTGRAGDNVGVSGVYYSLNKGDWLSAMTANNWSNWTAQVTLAVGANSLRAYSVDAAGNPSATNTVSLVYVLVAPLTVQISGKGTVSPNYNGALLQIGKNYSITATPATGSAFTNWTGGDSQVLTNGRTLTFTMASNLLFTANFLDVARPALTILSPTPNQMVTIGNEYFIHGTASDNVAVAAVWYQLNGGDWLSAYGTNNWQVSANLVPGTNTLKAYAVDTSGNASSTNTVNFVYVSKTMMSVMTTGIGTVSPNYNGVSLQIGQNYYMTASPGPGFAFTNWSSLQVSYYSGFLSVKPLYSIGTGGSTGFYVTNSTILTNKSTVLFTMTNGLYLAANFVDIAPPTITITTPTAGLRVSNTIFTVIGKAADNDAVSAVYYQINGTGWKLATPTDGWVLAISANGWTNWSAPNSTLLSGTNTLQAYAVDTSGNVSATNTINFINLHVDPAPDSLSGLVGSGIPEAGIAFSIGFGANTYSRITSALNNDSSVGTYTYTKLDATTGQLSIVRMSPGADGGTSTIDLTFTSPGVCTYYNENSGDTGSVSFYRSATLAPASVTGKKAMFFKSGGQATTAVFGDGTLILTNGSGEVQFESYTFQAYSPLVALLTAGDPDQGTNYVIVSFNYTNYGNYFNSDYDAAGYLQNYDAGVFVFPSAAPVAPASLTGIRATLTQSDGTESLVAFNAATFSQTSFDNYHDSYVGGYTYAKLGASNARLNLTVLGPPTETNNGGSVFLTFLAPDFCFFTNYDNESLSINTVSLLPASTSVAPASLAGMTVNAISDNNTVDVITFNTNGKFSQSETGSGGSGVSSGTYTYTVYSSVGALIKLKYTSPADMLGSTVYVQATFTVPYSGIFTATSYDNSGDAPNINQGNFTAH